MQARGPQPKKGDRFKIEQRLSESLIVKHYIALDSEKYIYICVFQTQNVKFNAINELLQRVVVKRYYDLSEGIPREALIQIDCLKATFKKPGLVYLLYDGSQYLEQLVDVYTRGKEIIIAIDQGLGIGTSHCPLSLESVFSQQKYYKVNEKIVKVYLYQILNGVAGIHQQGYIHRNINLNSIHLTQNEVVLGNVQLGSIILTGFEYSAKHGIVHSFRSENCQSDGIQDSDSSISEYVNQAKHYLAPEILLGQKFHSFSTDIWAVGCVMFRMLAGYNPFEEDSHISTLYRIFKTLGTPTQTHLLDFPTIANEQFCPLFSQCYDKFPNWKGLDMNELLPPSTSTIAFDLLIVN